MTLAYDIIFGALNAATVEDAQDVQDLIAMSVGQRYERPLADRWNNHGMMSSSGSYDLKLIELVTNMQDAVLERFALERHGDPSAIPYGNPAMAALALLGPLSEDQRTRLATVRFEESDPPRGRHRRLTAMFDDAGCGLTASQVPRTIFALGSNHKEGQLYLQGAFGLGGTMTYRNAQSVVLVSRRQPGLLAPGEDDRITVAVVQWEAQTKGQSAYYLVDRQWTEPGDLGMPWSAPASEFPSCAAGTHLALISYGTDGIHRRKLGDERSFDTILNTRLLRSVMPVRFDAGLRPRSEILRGLEHRLESSDAKRQRGSEILPFHHQGTTYHLPVSFRLFAKRQTEGERRSYVAYDHAVLFTSNGQVHHHWSPQQFRNRTKHKKLDSRILVVVDTDELPIGLRTSLFTSDRSTLVRNAPALRLEETVEAFLNDWEALREANSELLRESLSAHDGGPTAAIARRIARALTVRGYTVGGSGSQGGSTGPGGSGGRSGTKRKPITLHDDPTRLDGPDQVVAEIGKTRFITYILDAHDGFLGTRGTLQVECDDPVIGSRDITIGSLHGGRVRVSIAVSEDARPGTHNLSLSVKDWMRKSGGLGATLRTETKLQLVMSVEPTGTGQGRPTGGAAGHRGAALGNNVAVRWVSHEDEGRDEWTAATVGAVEQIPANILAADSEYEDLAALGETEIPTVVLNSGYTPWKTYLHGRTKALNDLANPKERYATGVGVHLLLMDQELSKRSRDDVLDPAIEEITKRATARAILSVLPAFDELAKEAGLEDAD